MPEEGQLEYTYMLNQGFQFILLCIIMDTWEDQLFPAEKPDFEGLGQDGKARAVVQAWRMILVLLVRS